ncbi:uncharacterized protein LOC121712145 isoform X3 [Alosa sapidissima]|uniref:uncharacterized protein LOC121712145 isoform X3 n=1 Tax=Alosa sapidissima TaxID=34773 RepID=UPI001C09A8D5|nr:uncharacterized protein LOC121712145 isoform X3 [Alosa sapidissima]XP_041952139.1 uncharacterized protein LOC121712145 isoform X3 [Alosa sapidissima]XP_041952140.1 uncharacterized protein LOC121712145 isoform X3 [Alosa sapidissima]
MTAVRLALIVLLLCLTHPQPGKCEVPHIVYSKERDYVKLPCENVIAKDCSTTTWLYSTSGTRSTVEVVNRGKIKSDNTNIADRLKLEPDCSLKIINITSQDAREYICRQFLMEDGNQNGEDRLVYLSVLTVSSSIPASEMKADTNVTFYCHLAIHDSQNNKGDIKLVWTDFDHHQVKDPYNIAFTRTLTKEDNNRKLQCKVEWKGELKATVDYIIKGQDGSHPVGLIGAVVGAVAVAVALCAFLVFLWRRKAKRQTANVRSENVSTNVPKEKTEDERKTSGQSKQAPGDQGVTYAEITITANIRKSSDKLPAQHETEYATVKTKC